MTVLELSAGASLQTFKILTLIPQVIGNYEQFSKRNYGYHFCYGKDSNFTQNF